MSTISYAEMLDRAVALDEHYKRSTLVLEPGDVAPSCCSTKYDLRAGEKGATVEYLISPGGIDVTVTEGSVGRAYREGATV